MTRSLPRALLLALLLAAACGAARPKLFYESPQLRDAQLLRAKALVLPVSGMVIRYSDNTKAVPDTLYTDSFLVAATNALLPFEAGRQLLVLPRPESLSVDSTARASVLAGDTAAMAAASQQAQRLAAASGAQVVVVAYACTTGFTVFQAEGWRGGRYESPAYARPIRAYGWARLHVQLWNAAGVLLFEQIGVATSGKPILYDLVKRPRKRPPRRSHVPPDIVTLARKTYGPPTVRAIYRAAKVALRFM